jgi:Ulp1 family protease
MASKRAQKAKKGKASLMDKSKNTLEEDLEPEPLQKLVKRRKRKGDSLKTSETSETSGISPILHEHEVVIVGGPLDQPTTITTSSPQGADNSFSAKGPAKGTSKSSTVKSQFKAPTSVPKAAKPATPVQQPQVVEEVQEELQ